MLWSAKDLRGYKLRAVDDELGKSKDILFDEESWTVRYLDVDAGGWFSSRRVLISPIALDQPNAVENVIPTILTTDQIKKSPQLEKNKPVSRQWEDDYYQHYNWPHYNIGPNIWGYQPYPAELRDPNFSPDPDTKAQHDPHLRSTNAVIGYTLRSGDEVFGSVRDFVVDSKTWSILYLLVETIKWLPSKTLLVPVAWVTDIDWVQKTIALNHVKKELEKLPHFAEIFPIPDAKKAYLEGVYLPPFIRQPDLRTNL